MARKKSKLNMIIGIGISVFLGPVLFGGVKAVSGGHHAHTTDIITTTNGPANEQLANKMAAARGWGRAEEDCLDLLWKRETGGTWDTHITDPIVVHGHLAYGIAQAIGHDPDGSHAAVTYEKFLNGTVTQGVTVDDYPSTAANAGDARAQIAWGLGYIASVYGTPCRTWSFEVANNGY